MRSAADFQASLTPAASVAILFNLTMACIVINEPFISIKRLVVGVIGRTSNQYRIEILGFDRFDLKISSHAKGRQKADRLV